MCKNFSKQVQNKKKMDPKIPCQRKWMGLNLIVDWPSEIINLPTL